MCVCFCFDLKFLFENSALDTRDTNKESFLTLHIWMLSQRLSKSENTILVSANTNYFFHVFDNFSYPCLNVVEAYCIPFSRWDNWKCTQYAKCMAYRFVY